MGNTLDIIIPHSPPTVVGVGLVSSSFTVNENYGYLRVGVEIQEGSLESEQSVLTLTQAGTATPGTCMSRMNMTVLIGPLIVDCLEARAVHDQVWLVFSEFLIFRPRL